MGVDAEVLGREVETAIRGGGGGVVVVIYARDSQEADQKPLLAYCLVDRCV